MPKPVYKLSNDEISDKASRIVNKLKANKAVTEREAIILNSCIGRYIGALATVKTTERWAQDAFSEVKRLTELLQERWMAGWKGEGAK